MKVQNTEEGFEDLSGKVVVVVQSRAQEVLLKRTQNL